MHNAVLVVGDTNADLVAPVMALPTPGDDIAVRQLFWASGGAAANVATGLACLGAPVHLLTCVGNDPAAEIALRAAIGAGVGLDFVQRSTTCATGLCYALVSPGGERSFLSYRGANIELALPKHDILDNIGWLHVTGYALLEGNQRSTTLTLIQQATERGIPISLDLCLPLLRMHAETTYTLLTLCTIVFGNQAEMTQFSAVTDWPGLLVTKQGAAGCEVRGRGAKGWGRATGEQRHENRAITIRVPGFPIEAVDTTGCGDAFIAAFLATIIGGETVEQAARAGNAAGAITAARHGAAESMPDRAALEEVINRK